MECGFGLTDFLFFSVSWPSMSFFGFRDERVCPSIGSRREFTHCFPSSSVLRSVSAKRWTSLYRPRLTQKKALLSDVRRERIASMRCREAAHRHLIQGAGHPTNFLASHSPLLRAFLCSCVRCLTVERCLVLRPAVNGLSDSACPRRPRASTGITRSAWSSYG